MNNEHHSSDRKAAIVIVAMILLGSVGYIGYTMGTKKNIEPKQQPCTQEAKICPDGSAVGRSGPDCEFAACPEASNKDSQCSGGGDVCTSPSAKNEATGTVPDIANGAGTATSSDTENLETKTDAETGLSYSYPADLATAYITAQDWPPALQIESKKFSCTQAGDAAKPAGKTEEKTIDGRKYCITLESEGAAGSIYLQYAYAFPFGEKTAILTATLREVQCANYDEPKKAACEAERKAFDFDKVMARVAATLQ